MLRADYYYQFLPDMSFPLCIGSYYLAHFQDHQYACHSENHISCILREWLSPAQLRTLLACSTPPSVSVPPSAQSPFVPLN